MIRCPNCSKENQAHYKFCLGCGAKLPQAGGAPPGPPAPQQAYGGQPAPAAHAAGPPAGFAALEGSPCPSCGTPNPPGFAFCGRCGTRLGAPAGAPQGETGSARTMYVDPGRPSAPAPAPSRGHVVKLVLFGSDGQPVGERVLQDEPLEVGRSYGPPWDDDPYLDGRHTSLRPAADGLLIEDHGTLNGVFMKLTTRWELRDGDQFRVGQELLQYEDLPEPTTNPDGTERMGSPNPGYWGRISVLVDPGRASAAYPIQGSGMAIGREQGDITFPQDGYVSGRHCRIVGDDTGVWLEDLGSSNGTYLRARSGSVVPFDSLILVGQKLFQVERP